MYQNTEATSYICVVIVSILKLQQRFSANKLHSVGVAVFCKSTSSCCVYAGFGMDPKCQLTCSFTPNMDTLNYSERKRSQNDEGTLQQKKKRVISLQK